MGRVIDVRPGITETFHYDDTTGDVAFQLQSDDLQPILDDNHQARSGPQGKELRRVASIPVWVQYHWIEQYGADPLAKGNEDLLRRLLNSNEWRHLRTNEGTV